MSFARIGLPERVRSPATTQALDARRMLIASSNDAAASGTAGTAGVPSRMVVPQSGWSGARNRARSAPSRATARARFCVR